MPLNKLLMNLKSTTQSKGRYVTQIIHFKGGEKLTFTDIDTHSIKQGEFTKMETKDGRLLMVNDKNVNLIEVFKQ